MNSFVPTKTTISSPSSSSSPPPPSSSSSHQSSLPPTPSPPHTIVVSPCAACKILRRRCTDKCVLAPYFPPSEPLKFTIAHRVFGASNIIKCLQELPESHRADAVSSMVFEANARVRDPIYGCAGVICQLQKQVNELQAQLASSQAELVTVQCQHKNLMALICMEMSHFQQPSSQQCFDNFDNNSHNFETNGCFLDDNNAGSPWEPLWT